MAFTINLDGLTSAKLSAAQRFEARVEAGLKAVYTPPGGAKITYRPSQGAQTVQFVKNGVTFDSFAAATAPAPTGFTATVSSPTVVEGEAGGSARFLQFVITLDRAPAAPVAVIASTTTGGTASAGQDFVGLTQTVTFAAGQTSAIVNVEVPPDSQFESNETVVLTVTGSPASVLTATASGTGTISNDDNALTAGTDVATGNTFNAGLVFTPGGNDRVNSLNDEDELTGTADRTDNTLNVTLGNANDAGSVTITPTLNRIQVVNASYSSTDGVGLDLQDATGLTTFNITRVSQLLGDNAINSFTDPRNARAINLPASAVNLSIANSNAFSDINLSYRTNALNGAETVTVGLSNVLSQDLRIGEQQTAINAREYHINNLALNVTDGNNVVQRLHLQDGTLETANQTLTINATGGSLTIGADTDADGDFIEHNEGLERDNRLASIVVTGAAGRTVTLGEVGQVAGFTLSGGTAAANIVANITDAAADATASFTTGSGTDRLLTTGSLAADATTGSGNDTLTVSAGGMATTADVDMGGDDDTVTVTGDLSGSTVRGAQVTLGAGNDTVSISNGAMGEEASITGGAGNDAVSFTRTAPLATLVGGDTIADTNDNLGAAIRLGENDDSVTFTLRNLANYNFTNAPTAAGSIVAVPALVAGHIDGGTGADSITLQGTASVNVINSDTSDTATVAAGQAGFGVTGVETLTLVSEAAYGPLRSDANLGTFTNASINVTRDPLVNSISTQNDPDDQTADYSVDLGDFDSSLTTVNLRHQDGVVVNRAQTEARVPFLTAYAGDDATYVVHGLAGETINLRAMETDHSRDGFVLVGGVGLFTGTSVADRLQGGGGVYGDSIDGGAGNDVLDGGGGGYYGSDSLTGGLGDDIFVQSLGNGGFNGGFAVNNVNGILELNEEIQLLRPTIISDFNVVSERIALDGAVTLTSLTETVDTGVANGQFGFVRGTFNPNTGVFTVNPTATGATAATLVAYDSDASAGAVVRYVVLQGVTSALTASNFILNAGVTGVDGRAVLNVLGNRYNAGNYSQDVTLDLTRATAGAQTLVLENVTAPDVPSGRLTSVFNATGIVNYDVLLNNNANISSLTLTVDSNNSHHVDLGTGIATALTVNGAGSGSNANLTLHNVNAATINTTAYAGNVYIGVESGVNHTITTGAGNDVVRLGDNAAALALGNESIDLGNGNDTLVFDGASSNAGLTSFDTVTGGAGSDELAFGGAGGLVITGETNVVKLDASEFRFVSGFETIRLGVGLGNNLPAGEELTPALSGASAARYDLEITNSIIDTNGADRADGDTGNDQLAIVVDNAATNSIVDVRTLNRFNQIAYTGSGGADRVIFADEGLDGLDTVAGGLGADVLEVRNDAVVTTTDLANVSSFETLEFVNDRAVQQTLQLTLDQATVAASGIQTIVAIGGGSTGSAGTFGVNTNSNGHARVVLDAASVTAALNVNLANGGIANDLITTGSGNDTITSGDGADSIIAGGGNDSITAGGGNDTVVGADAADTILGGANTDTLQLSASYIPAADGNLEDVENVVVTGNGAAVSVNLSNQLGEAFNVTLSNSGDTIVTADGADTITGGTGADSIRAGTGSDSIAAGAGNDTIAGADGADTILGGANTDTLQLSASYIPAADGNLEDVENVVVTGNGAAVSVDLSNQLGEAFNVTLSNSGDTIVTADGADTITGGTGADSITAGTGSDSIAAGAGNDTIAGADGADTILGGADTDTLRLSANYTPAADGNLEDVENVTLTALATVDLSNQAGEAFNVTFSNAGGTVTTADGNDTLTSGTGGDTINAGAGTNSVGSAGAGGGADTITHAAGTTTIAVTDGGVITLTASAVGATTNSAAATNTTVNASTSTAAVTLNGNTGTDSLTGGTGNDTIVGGTGVDSMAGGNGNDTFNVAGGDGADTINGGDGTADTIAVTAGNATLSANDGAVTLVENITLAAGTGVTATGQTEGFNITASTGAETVVGSGGNDTITAGDGADSITGGGGDDTVNLGGDDDDADVFVFSAVATNGRDTITGFETSDSRDSINVELLAAGNVAARVALAANSSAVANAGDQNAFVFADGADGTGAATITDYLDFTQVAAFLDAGLDGTADAENYVAIINDLLNNRVYVYNIDVDNVTGAANTIENGDVTLVGVISVDNNALLEAQVLFTA